jgi:hypothetical protein
VEHFDSANDASEALKKLATVWFAKTPARREINNIAAAVSPPFCYEF